MNSNKLYIDNKLHSRCLLLAINGDIITFKNNKLYFFIKCYQNIIDILPLHKQQITQELVMSGVNLIL